MTALRQQRIKAERERSRIAESFKHSYEKQIKSLLESNQVHMIEISRLNGKLIEKDREIEILTERLKTEVNQAITQYTEALLKTIGSIDHDYQQTAKRQDGQAERTFW